MRRRGALPLALPLYPNPVSADSPVAGVSARIFASRGCGAQATAAQLFRMHFTRRTTNAVFCRDYVNS